jgi:hypothetical protein
MLYFIGGMVFGGGVILAIYRLHIIPRWRAAVERAEVAVFERRRSAR